MQNINTLVATNGAQVGTAVSNLVYFSTQLTQLAASAQNLLATNGENIDVATKNIEDISVNLKQIVGRPAGRQRSGRNRAAK